MILKKTIPTGARNLEFTVRTCTVGTFHDLPLHCFISSLERERERERGGGGGGVRRKRGWTRKEGGYMEGEGTDPGKVFSEQRSDTLWWDFALLVPSHTRDHMQQSRPHTSRLGEPFCRAY